MFIKITDYHGYSVSLNPTKLLKLCPALASLGDPDGCTLIDWGTGGIPLLENADIATAALEHAKTDLRSPTELAAIFEISHLRESMRRLAPCTR
jgi:hypothetical protein